MLRGIWFPTTSLRPDWISSTDGLVESGCDSQDSMLEGKHYCHYEVTPFHLNMCTCKKTEMQRWDDLFHRGGFLGANTLDG